MGRSNTKLPLELIKNEKSRNITFGKRKKGLVKKTYELNKLCDVQCSVIIYENKPNGQSVLETYPENPEEVKQIIGTFISKSAKVKKVETLTEYFGKQIMQVKKETAKLRKKNNEARFPSWDDDKLNNLSLDQLQSLVKKLEHKIEDLRQRFDKQYTIDEGVLRQTAMLPNNNTDYSQMVALNQYPTSGLMMYTSDRVLPEEQSNLQSFFQGNLITYHQNYINHGSMIMNRNGMPWQNYSIQSVPSTSNGSNYVEESTSMKCENHLQYGSINENLTLCNHAAPPLQTTYPMSASYLFDNANQFWHLKGQP